MTIDKSDKRQPARGFNAKCPRVSYETNQSDERKSSAGDKIFILVAILYCSWNMLYFSAIFSKLQLVETFAKYNSLVAIVFSFTLASILLVTGIFRPGYRLYISDIVLVIGFVSLGLLYIFSF